MTRLKIPINFSMIKSLIIASLCLCLIVPSVDSQRSLLHWKRDLELRLESYINQKNIIHNIISSSIYPPRQQQDFIQQRPTIIKGQNIRFTDLIINNGALILDRHIARSTVRFLMNKTQGYVSSKGNELYHMTDHLDQIKRRINDPNQRYIYKGSPNEPRPQLNRTIIPGQWVFKQFVYGHRIESDQVFLNTVNYTNVDNVLRETYMENPQFTPYDSNNRLFFEGRKTFWRTVFAKDLKSGCCDRLKPLHTNRMMLKSVQQDVLAPVLIQSNSMYRDQPVLVGNLSVNQLHNRAITITPPSPGTTGWSLSQPENFIHLNNLINIRLLTEQPELMKRLIFRNIVQIDEAFLSLSPDHRLLIGIPPLGQSFDLDLENYLLRHYGHRMYSNATAYQQVKGVFVLNGDTHFLQDIEAETVNRVPNFRNYVTMNIARIDRPAVINSMVQFNALPSIYDTNRPLHSIPIVSVARGATIGLINGMRFPDDFLFMPPHPLAPRPGELIRVRGLVNFSNDLLMRHLVTVRNLVNGIQMPAGVIPLHLNDFMSSVGLSNLVFLDGMTAQSVTVQSGVFDELQLRDDVYDDAQHLIVRSVFSRQPDQSQIIRAPLRVVNLRVFGAGPNRGLLNGFKPNDVIELQKHFNTNSGSSASVGGRKNFLRAVEATDCVFQDINNLANWTNHLIRIDRPHTVQTIHTRLAFVQPEQYLKQSNNPTMPPMQYLPPGSVQVDRLKVDFNPKPKHLTDHVNNWNFSPEFYILHNALARGVANQTGGRYRVLNQVRLIQPSGQPGRVNGIQLDDIVTLDAPFRFADRFVMVGKVEVTGDLRANRINSNYPLDAMDLNQFDKFRVPILGSQLPVQLNNLVLADGNKASFVQTHLLNGIPWNEFVSNIMSLTRPQLVDSNLVFHAPVELAGLVRTESSVNGIPRFKEFAQRLKTSGYSFENGLQCNTVIIRT